MVLEEKLKLPAGSCEKHSKSIVERNDSYEDELFIHVTIICSELSAIQEIVKTDIYSRTTHSCDARGH